MKLNLLAFGFSLASFAILYASEVPKVIVHEPPHIIEEYPPLGPLKLFRYAELYFINKTNNTIMVRPIRKIHRPYMRLTKIDPYDRQLLLSTKINLDTLESIKVYYSGHPEKALIIPANELIQRLEQKASHLADITITATDGNLQAQYSIVPGAQKRARLEEIPEEEMVALHFPMSPEEEKRILFEALSEIQGVPLTPQSTAYQILKLEKPPIVTNPAEIMKPGPKKDYLAKFEAEWEELKPKIDNLNVAKQLSLQGVDNPIEKLYQIARSAHDQIADYLLID